jgi:signal transduction histidine kinase
MDNALRFSPVGGRIALRTGVDGDMARLSVADEGPGVPEDERQLIFERFRRGRTGTEDGAGFGLGLAIGRQLAEQMDGELQVADEGSGACFVLSLVATVDP